jgi:hypothetical protein
METPHQSPPDPSQAPESPEKVWDYRRRTIANNVAESYRGTPHVNRLCLKGEGIDCIHFVLEILTSAGVVPRFRLPFYDERLGAFRARNVLEDLFHIHFYVTSHDPYSTPEFGDIVISQCGRQANHIGIMLDGWFWHVASGGFCSPEDWNAWKGRAQSLLRFQQIGLRADPNRLRWHDIKTLADRAN